MITDPGKTQRVCVQYLLTPCVSCGAAILCERTASAQQPICYNCKDAEKVKSRKEASESAEGLQIPAKT